MLNFEQACRRMKKHYISVIYVDGRWYAGDSGFLTGWKAGAFVYDGLQTEDRQAFSGSTIEEAVDKYCTARGLSS